MIRPSARVLDLAGLAVRLGLAAVWLVSGAVKVVDPAQTRVAVAAYRVLPEVLVGPAATGLPLLELALGNPAGGGGVHPLGRGRVGGAVDAASTRYPREVARDTGFLLLLAAWLVARPRTALAVDRWLGHDGGVGAAGRASGADDDEVRAGHPAGTGG